MKASALFFSLIILLTGCESGNVSKPQKDEGPVSIITGETGGWSLSEFMKQSGSQSTTLPVNAILWRASLDILEPFVFSTVDYAGGLVITDWYSEDNPEEAIKITVRFLTNEIRADALAVTIHKKDCDNLKCTINKIDTDLTFQITDKILKKAAYFASLDKEKLKRLQKAKPQGKHKKDK